MKDLITIAEAAKILDVTLSTVSYYVRTGKLASVEGDKRTAHRKQQKMVSRADVEKLKSDHDAQEEKESK